MKVNTIKIGFYNSFTGEEYLVMTAPYNRTKAMNSWYSRWCRKAKILQAEIWSVDKRFIKTKFTILN